MTASPDLDNLLLLGVTLTRIGAAGVLVPVFAPAAMPAVVRNSAFVGLSLIELIWRPIPLGHWDLSAWLSLFARELFIGLCIGVLFSGVMWALEIAGGYIDRKVSPSSAGLSDLFTGEEAGSYQTLLGRLGAYAFAAGGGLMLLVTSLLQSYAWFPATPSPLHLALHDTSVFEGYFQRVMALSLVFAAPALILLTTTEAAMSLLSRFAPQMNLFGASMAIKSWLAIFILLTVSGLLMEAVANEVLREVAGLAATLARLVN